MRDQRSFRRPDLFLYYAVKDKMEIILKPTTKRSFIVFPFMTVLDENRHTIVTIEHDPLLCEDAKEITEYVSQAMRKASKEAAVLLYAPRADPYFEELVKNADRVFYFDEGPRSDARVVAKAIPWTQKSQTTLEAFS